MNVFIQIEILKLKNDLIIQGCQNGVNDRNKDEKCQYLAKNKLLKWLDVLSVDYKSNSTPGGPL